MKKKHRTHVTFPILLAKLINVLKKVISFLGKKKSFLKGFNNSAI